MSKSPPHRDEEREKLLAWASASTFGLDDDTKILKGSDRRSTFAFSDNSLQSLTAVRKHDESKAADVGGRNGHDRKVSEVSATLSSGGATVQAQNLKGRNNKECVKGHRSTVLVDEKDLRRNLRGKKRRGDRKFSLVGNIIFILVYATLLAYTLMVLIGPVALHTIDKSVWCPDYDVVQVDSMRTGKSSKDSSFADGGDDDGGVSDSVYENPDYITDPCRYTRIPYLMYLTLEECDLSRRMLASVLFGGSIGYERRSADRPAGIRTMGLVSLGSCFFTISSQLAFKASTMSWDSSRVTAAIPTGVGFLGAGLIWKGTVGVGDQEVHQVHGLTTAASLWLSAAIGVGAGGALYFVTAYSTILVVMVLRFGPKLYLQDDASYNDEDEEPDEEEDSDNPTMAEDFDEKNVEYEHRKDSKPGVGDWTRRGATDGERTVDVDQPRQEERVAGEFVTSSAVSNATELAMDAAVRQQLRSESSSDFFYGSIRSVDRSDTENSLKSSLRSRRAITDEDRTPTEEELSEAQQTPIIRHTFVRSPSRSRALSLPREGEKKQRKRKPSDGRPSFHN